MAIAGWQRDVHRLAATRFDVLIVGGGIYGAALAVEAARAGLGTALVEARDFGHATSASSLRIMHGGLRYLQHLDLRRMRQSVAARREWLALYPDLVRPQAFHLPTTGHGWRGPEVHRLAMALNDIVSFDANRGLSRESALPRSRMLGKAERAAMLDRLELPAANGVARWYDGLILDSERLLLYVLDEAVGAGARIANHLRAVRLATNAGRVVGVELLDEIDGGQHLVEAARVVDATGPWAGGWTGAPAKDRPFLPARAFNLLTRRLDLPHAVGVPMPDHGDDRDDLFKKGSQTSFLVPWGDYTLIGTRHLPARADGGRRIRAAEVQAFVDDVNSRLRGRPIAAGDVLRVFDGVLPANAPGAAAVSKTPRLVDHGASGGPQGLVTVSGVKWTTARTVARAALPLLGATPAPQHRSGQPPTAMLPPRDRRAAGLAALGATRPAWSRPLPDGNGATGAEVAWAAREEMAMTLADVVFRRTGLGLAADCAPAALAAAAEIMADVHGWSERRAASEIESVAAEQGRLARQAGRAVPPRAATPLAALDLV